jgi:hypothetical protein
LNPPKPVIDNEYAAVWPALIVAEDEEPEATTKLKSWPAPVRLTVCGLVAALSLIVRDPL